MNNKKSTFNWGKRTYVMGIMNITPDSFSGDGLIRAGDLSAAALEQARRFVSAGADILDIGGESTRPGSTSISVEEELDRVLPVIHILAASELDCVISIDTYKSTVAEAALDAGAGWINDIWGLKVDPRLAEIAACYNTPLVLMHNRSQPDNVEIGHKLGGRFLGASYEDLIQDIKNELMESVSLARCAGVRDDQIILDPGVGFGKSVEQNLAVINRLGEIRALGFPLLLGTSRKAFIGYTLNLPLEERLEGTMATIALGIARGADIVRVHDVESAVRVARMTDAIVR